MQIISAVFAVLIAISCTTAASPIGSRIVSTGWLRRNLDREDIRIVDVRANAQQYKSAHVQGAVYLNLSEFANPEAQMQVDPQKLARTLGRAGISEKHTIIVYDDPQNLRGSFLIWALDLIMHPEAALLDGGFIRWNSEGRPVDNHAVKGSSVQYSWNGQLDKWYADLEKGSPKKGGLITLYAGSKRNGNSGFTTQRDWHSDADDSGNWINAAELEMAYSALGVTRTSRILIGCESGIESARTYMALKHILGYTWVAKCNGRKLAPSPASELTSMRMAN